MSAHDFSATRRRLLAALGVALAAGPALAQEWPGGKTITYVVPYPPGGSTDVLGRNIAQRLGPALGTTVIVDNKPGATGTIGAAFVARAQPDGYTLLGTTIGPQAIAPHLMGKLPYDPIAGFEPVITLGTIPHILVVGAGQPFQGVADLVAAGKAQPGKLAYASGGNGTILQMQAELLQQQTGARFIHVPYKGDTPALQDTLGGQVQFMFAPAAAALPHVQAGKLRALAVTDPKRSPLLPDVPSLAELGYRDIAAGAWNGFFAPKGTPAAVVQTLNTHLNEILRMPEVAAKMATFGAVPVGGSPQVLADVNAADYERLGKVIRELGITAE